MGSYKPGVVLKSAELKSEIVGAPAREAEGNSPKEPGMTLDSSERLVLSANPQENSSPGALTCLRTSSQ